MLVSKIVAALSTGISSKFAKGRMPKLTAYNITQLANQNTDFKIETTVTLP